MSTLNVRTYLLRLGGCVLLLGLLLVISPGIGSESGVVGWRDAWRAWLGRPIAPVGSTRPAMADLDRDGVISSGEADAFSTFARHIGFGLRLPRSWLALQVGATLAICGAAFQVLFRNALATPFTFGIAGGGSLGAIIAIRLGWQASYGGVASSAISAFVGGLAVVAIVVLISRRATRLTSNEILLAGVTMGMFCQAMIMLVTVASNQQQTFEIVRWMMGSLDTIGPVEGARWLPLMLPAWIVLIFHARALNQYRLGEELAATRGVHVARLQLICVAVCTLGTAAVVAQCGPIGFVGLVVPHMAALIVGPDCRLWLPASAILGAAFLILCDWASQLIMGAAGWIAGQRLAGATLPIGVVTAMVGVPMFLFLLQKRMK